MNHPAQLVRGKAGKPWTLDALSTLALCEALSSCGGATRRRLIYEVGRRTDDFALPYLEPLARARSASTRWEAVDAIARIGSQSSSDLLRELLARETGGVLRCVLYAIKWCNARSCAGDIAEMARTTANGEDATALLTALDGLGEYRLLQDLLWSQDIPAREAVANWATRNHLYLAPSSPPWEPRTNERCRWQHGTQRWIFGHPSGLETEVFPDGIVFGLDNRERFRHLDDDAEYPLWTVESVDESHIQRALHHRRNDYLPTLRRVGARVGDDLSDEALEHLPTWEDAWAREVFLLRMLNASHTNAEGAPADTFVQLVRDPEPGVRAAALAKLSVTPCENVVRTLVAAWHSEAVPGVRHHLLSRLPMAGEQAIPLMLASLESPDPVERRAAALALRNLPRSRSAIESLTARARLEPWSYARDEINRTLIALHQQADAQAAL